MLEIRNVTKIYRSKTGEEVKALDNVSISFPESGMVFILGKSGSGKSTLLNVMGGLDSYDSGEFIIKGKSSNDFVGSDFDAYRNTFIGFIFQEYNVLDDFTVGANIGLALELQGKKATEEKINEILASVDLLNYAHRKPNELSGGQKQRVAIARALVKEPQIIMADEPTGALDSNTGKQIFDTLKELSKTKLVLIVSHDRDFAERYADRIVELADGRIIEDVTKHEKHAMQLSEGLHAINDSILRIESGYKLTAADLDMINAYLAKANGDIILSGDGRVNEELRSAAGISKDGSTTVFEGTVPEKDIKTKKYEKGDSKFIRSRLPMKNAVKMGASGLKHKKFRLAMTILLSFISFAMFGLSSSMAAYEKVHAATQSIIDTEIRSAAMTMGVRRTTTYEDGDMYSWHESHAMNDEDMAKLKELTGLNFLPVFTGYDRVDKYGGSQNFDMKHVFKQYEDNSVFSGRIAGLIDIEQNELPAEYQLMAGTWRANQGEVVITEFFLRQLQQYGYTDGTTTIEGQNVTAEAMIGKTISIRNIGWSTLSDSSAYTLKIVGVLNTNFNYDRYQNLMPVASDQHQPSAPQEEPSLMDMFLEREVGYERDFGFHGMAFAHADDIAAMTAMMGMNYGGSSLGEYMSGFNSSLYLSVYKPPEVDGDNPASVNVWMQRVGGSSLLPQLDKVTFDGAARDALAADEMMISYSKLMNSEFLP
ncbi:MAG: ABC transporter ATP-binding protein, partial [Clostridia bacterium]|nr:ABC transporter ATP-binding protein [Clostridia bacterium]